MTWATWKADKMFDEFSPNPTAEIPEAESGASGWGGPSPTTTPTPLTEAPEPSVGGGVSDRQPMPHPEARVPAVAGHLSPNPTGDLTEAVLGSSGWGDTSATTTPVLATEADRFPVGGGGSGPDQAIHRASTSVHPPDRDPFLALRLYAEIFNDAQRARIRYQNRTRVDERAPWRYTVPETVLSDLIGSAEHTEKLAKGALLGAWRLLPLPSVREWVDETLGLGAHSMARLLGIIGHPAWKWPMHWEGTGPDRVLVEDEPGPRSLRQLRAYCAVGDPALRRARGMTADEVAGAGRVDAKTMLLLCADGCVKVGARSPYRRIYDDVKARYQEERAGGDDPWTKGRIHYAARRVMAKQILTDLWELARDDLHN